MFTSRIMWLTVLALGTTQLQLAATAEETLRADTPRLDTRTPVKRAPLSGQISVHATHLAPHKSILAKPVVAKVAPKVAAPVPTLSASANSYRGAPMQGTLDRNRDLIRGFNNYNPYNPYAMRVHTERPKWTNADDAPYRWAQSGSGGYYDATGTYKGALVWGDKLATYGGRFFDGTPVPKGEVKINSMGHIWWQNQLSTSFVKREDLRKQGFNE